MKIKIRNLHLAAFVKINGAQLLGTDDGQFVFESSKTVAQWRMEHLNSCCRQVDRELLDLRRLLPRK